MGVQNPWQGGAPNLAPLEGQEKKEGTLTRYTKFRAAEMFPLV